MNGGSARVALFTVTDETFLPGTAVMAHSFLRHNPWFDGDIIVVSRSALKSGARTNLATLSSRLTFRDPGPMLMNRLTSLCEQLPQYRKSMERFLFLEALWLGDYDYIYVCDGDLLFLESVESLQAIDSPIVATPDGAHYAGVGRHRLTFEWDGESDDRLTNTFNCGFLRLRRDILREEIREDVLARLEPSYWSGVKTGSTDQYLYNRYFSGNVTLVGPEYNLVLRHLRRIKQQQPHIVSQAKVIHFNLSVRPWDLRGLVEQSPAEPEIQESVRNWHAEFRIFLEKLDRGALATRSEPVFRGAQHDLEGLIETHLFVISPNNSGSTFLKNVLAKSRYTWNLKREGQYTFGFSGPTPVGLGKPLLWASDDEVLAKLQGEHAYNWENNRRAWYFQSFGRSGEGTVFVEKSPQFLLHVGDLAKAFGNAKFVFLVRDPYAVAEGILRRHARRFPSRIEAIRCASRHILTCLRWQKKNIELWANVGILVTYEEMCRSPFEVADRIKGLVPALKDINLDQQVEVKGMYNEPLRDMNRDQIARLSASDIEYLGQEFEAEQELLRFFGYDASMR